MSYIQSKNVIVFPSANRVEYSKSMQLSEDNFANIVRTVTDYHDYIISINESVSEFVLHGYYFRLTGDYRNKVAVIRINKTTNAIVNYETGARTDTTADGQVNSDKSSPLDVNGEFKGLQIFPSGTAIPSGTDDLYYSLTLSKDNLRKFSDSSVMHVTTADNKNNGEYLSSLINHKANTVKTENTPEGYGITATEDSAETTLKFNDKTKGLLDSIPGKGQGTSLITTVTTEGTTVLADSTASMGGIDQSSAAIPLVINNICLANGEIGQMNSIYVSGENAPEEAPAGITFKAGDIWFKCPSFRS